MPAHRSRRTPGRLDVSAVKEAFDAFLTGERGLSAASKVSYWFVVRRFLAGCGGRQMRFDSAALGPTQVTEFVVRHAAEVSARTLQTMASALRSFLRFLFRRGWTATDLSSSVLTARSWRDAVLPRYLSADDVERLVQSCDLRTRTGRRDHAILLLQARLGLRATEVVALCLDDIDWRAGEILVRGKGHFYDRLPLPCDVGAALAAYLRRDRRGPTRRVFVRATGAPVPFTDGQAVNFVLRRALDRTGVRMPAKWVGSHVFRHSLATTTIRRGASLREIGDVLRHRSADTTTIYAKVKSTQHNATPSSQGSGHPRSFSPSAAGVLPTGAPGTTSRTCRSGSAIDRRSATPPAAGATATGPGAHLRCRGKGRKERCTPLRRDADASLAAWLREHPAGDRDPVFATVRGRPLSRDAVERIVTKHVEIAATRSPSLAKKRVTPHVLRHTAAMDLLQHGVDRAVIALWLGHESVETTQIYLHADLQMKEAALARTVPLDVARGRYRPDDQLLVFLEAL